ncbi:hypothetical protein GCM10009678_01210 [Actinomadura kijaniata]|uniref:Membrane-associated oxidoreductase n=1 Tax=Actinomadura namibiensis TaxID=182080 RepID=A0A7W3QNS5_ACTNM|nr:hypothetical protein [Actinomadura namibiensis]MBA8953353.1 hypothetical protein [Actinomadura namibiensis]
MERHELTDAERRLWDAYPSGQIVTFPDGATIRAQVIALLLLGAAEPTPGRYPGVRLRGARVTGRLDLDGTAFDTMLDCGDCVFEHPVSLAEATVRTLRITDSRLPAFKAPRLRATGLLSLQGSTIDRDLRLDHARLESEVRLADTTAGHVRAHTIDLQGTLNAAGITVNGEFSVRGGHITGDLVLTGAHLSNPGQPAALQGDAATIDGHLRAANTHITGAVLLRNAHIGSGVSFDNARLSAPGHDTLNAGGMTVGGGVFCWHGFHADGGVRLIGAQISGNLTFDNARLHHPTGKALDLDSAACTSISGQNLHVTAGEVSMRNTRVAGQVDLDHAHLHNPDGPRSLAIDHAELGLVSLRRLRAHGQVMLRATRINTRLLLPEAELHHPHGTALHAPGTEIGADLIAHDLLAEGQLHLHGTRVGQHLDLTGLRLSAPQGTALHAYGLTTAQLSLLPAAPIDGTVVLAHARIGVLHDDPQHWPTSLDANGLTYQALEPRLPAKQRLTWLNGDHHGFESQPYEQLAANYTALGLHADARHVLHAKERHRLDGETPLIRLWGKLQDTTTGYGYQPWRAFLWLTVLLTIGSLVYGLHPPAPLKADEAPHFNPVIYTLDLMIPLINLGQERAFNPAGALQWLSYAFVAAGWVLATTIAAGAARVFNRR